MNKPDSITNLDWELLKNKYKNLDKIVKKIENNYPVQYLIGNVNFYGYEILVNKNVLIPRFETEILLEKTINYIKKYKLEESNVLEIGTGSGCIPIVLKGEIPSLTITSIDKSIRALRVAKKNIEKNNMNIELIHKNMKYYNPEKKFNILISNPPYICEDDDIDVKILHEPKNAIFARDKGLEFYKIILDRYNMFLNDKFIIAFEIGDKQGNILREISKEKFPDASITVEKDLAGKDRYLFIINE